MTRQRLEDVLAELHAQLSEVDDLAPDEVARLRAAAQEIQVTLDRSDDNATSLSQQWDDATQSFTKSHPVLASTIGRIADLLSQIGI